MTHEGMTAGVAGLTRAVAREHGSRGTTVNAVAPGLVEAGYITGQVIHVNGGLYM